jgi:hypothetical protein
MTQDACRPSLPWWRVPTLWLVIGGPVLAVVGSMASLVLALRGGDTPLREASTVQPQALTPATQARNHAAAPRR